MSRFLNERVSALKPYVPGEQPKGREYIKLNTNESPYPPSPSAIRAASEAAERLMLYPDPDCTELLRAVAADLGVSASQLILTNGSDEVLNFAFMAYCDERTPAVFADITYGFYKVFADLNGIPMREIPLRDDFSLNIEDYISACGTVFIANPNAPTGLYLPLSEIERLLKSDSERIVVVDEAYVDFGSQSAVSLIGKYDNLLVTRTFSKSRSMAGARLGFGVASDAIIDDLMRIKYSTNPYNVNRMTAAAGIGSVADADYFEKNRKEIIETREWTSRELSALGFSLTDSAANFIFAKHERIGGEELYLALKARGVLVRHFSGERIKEYNRITVGSPREMRVLVDTVKSILEEKI
ncbi:MAG: histidinol-phosphate transaminase [Clostridia bacterium]|nr:histidinol-phosphate transaminase [Clostridia bacterium]